MKSFAGVSATFPRRGERNWGKYPRLNFHREYELATQEDSSSSNSTFFSLSSANGCRDYFNPLLFPPCRRRYKNFSLPGKIFINVVIPPGGEPRKKRCNCDYRWFVRKMIRVAAKDLLPRNFSKSEVNQVIGRLVEAFIHFTLYEWYVIISDTKSDNRAILRSRKLEFSRCYKTSNHNLLNESLVIIQIS